MADDTAIVPAEGQELRIAADSLPDKPDPPITIRAGSVAHVLPSSFYKGASELVLTDDERKKLKAAATPPDDEIDERDGGFLYAGHGWCREQLNDIFGPGQWALVPGADLTMPKDAAAGGKAMVYQRWVMLVRGCYISEALVAKEFYGNNARMDYSDIAESLKSDALRRCCKDLGIGIALWKKHFQEQFKARKRKGGGGTAGTSGVRGTEAPTAQSKPPEQPPPPEPRIPTGPTPLPPLYGPSIGSQAKPVAAPKAAPAPYIPAERAPQVASPKTGGQLKLIMGQINRIWALARTAKLVIGQDANSLCDLLESQDIPRPDSTGKTSSEVAAAMIAAIPPAKFQAIQREMVLATPAPAPASEKAESDTVI